MEEQTLENLISRFYNQLNSLNDERLSGISQLLQSGSRGFPVTILKQIKQNVQDLAETAPDLFFYAAIFYYAKFIQSIEIENLVAEQNLILQYLKTIKIMKTLCGHANLGTVDFDPFIRAIIECIKEILFSCGSIEKIFECLNILEKIKKDFAILDLDEKDKYEFLDLGMQDYVEIDDELFKSYSAIKKLKEWGYDLFLSEGSWIAKVRRRLEEENKETCDKNLIKNILILFNFFENEYYPEIKEEIIKFCEKFAIDSSEIFDSLRPEYQDIKFLGEASVFSSEFCPIFEDHLIKHRSQFVYKGHPLSMGVHKNISVWKGYCLLNQKMICVKEYNGNDEKILYLFTTEVDMNNILSRSGLPFCLKQYGSFDYGTNHYIAMELCSKDLRDLITKKHKFSASDFAYFAYLFISGLRELKKAKIYHRDIKPENIMISFDNEFKLIDFNISKKIEIDNADISIQSGDCKHTGVGTPEYCSPEKWRFMKKLSENGFSEEKNDVYSLGLVILEMYNFQEGFNEGSIREKIRYIGKIEIAWLSELLNSMLINSPSKRPRFKQLLEMIMKNPEFMNDFNEYHKRKKNVFSATI